jgi:hypothetical protein
VDKLRDHASWAGRTHLQKAVFVAQAMLGLPLGFDFGLHHYGPYSPALERTVDRLCGGQTLRLVDQTPFGPRIATTGSADHLRAAEPEVLARYDKGLSFVAAGLGSAGVKELERLATALWFTLAAPRATVETTAALVCEAKPHISAEHALAACNNVRALGAQARELGLIVSKAEHHQDVPEGPAVRHPLAGGETSHGIVDPPATGDPHVVFVVHGRDQKARGAIFGLLYTAGLKPESMPRASRHAPARTPFTLDAIESGMRAARAVIVLMAPEEAVVLAPELSPSGNDDRGMQPRPNVYVELGMARLIHPERTIVVEIGAIRSATNLDGLNVIRLDDGHDQRSELLRRLENAGCPVDWDTEWASPAVTGSFSATTQTPRVSAKELEPREPLASV